MKAYIFSIGFGLVAGLWFVLMAEMVRQEQLQYSLEFAMLAVLFAMAAFLFAGNHDIVLRRKDESKKIW